MNKQNIQIQWHVDHWPEGVSLGREVGRGKGWQSTAQLALLADFLML